jgi:hypothetical protein
MAFDRALRSIQPHQTLAIARAETAGVLRVTLEWDDASTAAAATRAVAPRPLPPAHAKAGWCCLTPKLTAFAFSAWRVREQERRFCVYIKEAPGIRLGPRGFSALS